MKSARQKFEKFPRLILSVKLGHSETIQKFGALHLNTNNERREN